MKRLLAINGSYRDGGIIDQAVETAVRIAREAGAEVDVVVLRDFPIEFCRNCRECTQAAGESPGVCVQHDRMRELIDRVEAVDGYILASPTNFYSVTALFKRFMERLLVYAYWPWGARGPKFRKSGATKKAILIGSCAAPGWMGHLFYGTARQLRATARTLGAKPVGSSWIGLVSQETHPALSADAQRQVRRLVARLL